MRLNSGEKWNTKSAIFFSLTSMIGSGVFIKTQILNYLANNQKFPIILLFFIFLLNILAFSYVLMKLIPSQTGNMGLVEWSKKFCSPRIHSCICSFIRYFYHPVSLVLFSIYAVTGIIGTKHIGVIAVLFLAFTIVSVLMFTNLISFKWSHKIQRLLWWLILLPLTVLPILGWFGPDSTAKKINTNASPWWILIAGLPHIIFIYDGFYGVASLKDKLENPKDLKNVVIGSLILVTVIYLHVIIGFSIGGSDYRHFYAFKKKPILRDIFEILISCASLLTLNSIVMSNMPQLISMQEAHRFEDTEKFRKFIFYKRKKIDMAFEEKFSIWLKLMLKVFISFFVLGILLIIFRSVRPRHSYLSIINALADIISLFTFVALVAIILGGWYKNRYQKSVTFGVCVSISAGVVITALSFLISSYLKEIKGDMAVAAYIKLIFLVIVTLGTIYRSIVEIMNKNRKTKNSLLYPRIKNGTILSFK